jgi:hypothetical protein
MHGNYCCAGCAAEWCAACSASRWATGQSVAGHPPCRHRRASVWPVHDAGQQNFGAVRADQPDVVADFKPHSGLPALKIGQSLIIGADVAAEAVLVCQGMAYLAGEVAGMLRVEPVFTIGAQRLFMTASARRPVGSLETVGCAAPVGMHLGSTMAFQATHFRLAEMNIRSVVHVDAGIFGEYATAMAGGADSFHGRPDHMMAGQQSAAHICGTADVAFSPSPCPSPQGGAGTFE